jgi:transposase-like protein
MSILRYKQNSQKYKCPDCSWTGLENDMAADYCGGQTADEFAWCSWICPSCHTWFDLEDYEKVNDEQTN